MAHPSVVGGYRLMTAFIYVCLILAAIDVYGDRKPPLTSTFPGKSPGYTTIVQ